MAQKSTNDKKEILQDLDGGDLPPSPYWLMTCLPHSAPPGPEGALMPDPRPGEVPATAATPVPTFLGFPNINFIHSGALKSILAYILCILSILFKALLVNFLPQFH